MIEMDNNMKHSIFEMYDCMFNLVKFADYEASLDKKSKMKLLLRLSTYSFVLSIWTVLIIGFSISYFSNTSFSSNFLKDFVVCFITATIFVIPFGIIASFIILIAFKYGGDIVGGLALGITLGFIIAFDSFSFTGTPPSGVPGAMAIGIVAGVGSGVIFGILTLLSGFNRGIGVALNIGTIFGIAAGVAGIIWGTIGVGIGIGIIFGIAFGISLSIIHKFISNTAFGIENCILFSVIGGVFSSFIIGTAGGIAESITFFIFYSRLVDIFPHIIHDIIAKYSNNQSDENTVSGIKHIINNLFKKTPQNKFDGQESSSSEAPKSQKSFIKYVYTAISQSQLLSGLVLLILGIILQKIFL